MRLIALDILCVLMVLVGCGTNYVQDVVLVTGTVIDLDSARFEFPNGAVTDSLTVVIQERNITRRTYGQGYTMTSIVYAITPSELTLTKPILFSSPVRSPNAILGARIGDGFVPLANSFVEGETLYAQLWHGGEYCIVETPEKYGIINHSDVESALLIVTDPYVSDYVKKFKDHLGQHGYVYPVWIYVYDIGRSIENNAFFLVSELKQLHEHYGNFRLDIVSFGIGGLVFHRYVADTSLYLHDVSSAIIAVGTPFHGSNLVSIDGIRTSGGPYAYFYMDGLSNPAHDIGLESDLISWVLKHRYIVAGHYYDNIEENKNFASIRGVWKSAGGFTEDSDGDGLVSLNSGMLTAIEPEPLPLDHFALFEDRTAHEFIAEFVDLYRTFNWPLVFNRVWRGEESMATVASIWEREARLHYGDEGIEILLQWNENMLNSTPQDAILVTNGDNDTYPAWYLQEKGIRDDITIVNRNLLNVKEYAMYLQQHKSLPLNMDADDLERINHKKVGGRIIMIADQLIEILVENGERSVVFSTTVYNPEEYGYPLTLSGVVYEIGEGDTKVNDKYVDVDRTWQLYRNTFKFDKFLAADRLSDPIRSMYRNFAGSLFMLHLAFIEQSNYGDALDVLRYIGKLKPDDETMTLIYFNEGMTYVKMGEHEQADSLFRLVIGRPNVRNTYMVAIAEKYYGWNKKEEAIKILADCLKKEPDNKSILDLIKRYQGEL